MNVPTKKCQETRLTPDKCSNIQKNIKKTNTLKTHYPTETLKIRLTPYERTNVQRNVEKIRLLPYERRNIEKIRLIPYKHIKEMTTVTKIRLPWSPVRLTFNNNFFTIQNWGLIQALCRSNRQ